MSVQNLLKTNSTNPSSALPVAGAYNTVAPAPIDGQSVPLQTDSAGNLLVNVVTGGPSTTQDVNLTKVAGSAVAVAATGVQLVGIEGRAGTSFETTAGVLDENIKNVGNSAVATAAAGIQKVGLTDGTGNAITSTTNALDVNLKTSSLGSSNMVGTSPGTAPADTSIVGGIYNSSAPTFTNGQTGPTQLDVNGRLLTTTQEAVATTGGATPKGFHISSNAVQAIKSSAGQMYGYFLDNIANSATTYFQFFNIASGSVSLGSSTPLFVIPVPAGLAANLSMSEGWAFSSAMSFAATTTYNGSTAPASAVDCTIAYN